MISAEQLGNRLKRVTFLPTFPHQRFLTLCVINSRSLLHLQHSPCRRSWVRVLRSPVESAAESSRSVNRLEVMTAVGEYVQMIQSAIAGELQLSEFGQAFMSKFSSDQCTYPEATFEVLNGVFWTATNSNRTRRCVRSAKPPCLIS